MALRRSWMLLLAAVLLGPSLARADDDTDDTALLSAVTIATAPNGVTVRVDLSAPRAWHTTWLQDPYRVVFDFADTRLKAGVPAVRNLGHRFVKSVRAGQYSDDPAVARVVLDLTSSPAVGTSRADGGRTVFIGIGNGAGRPARPARSTSCVSVTGARWHGEADHNATLVIGLSDSTDVLTYTRGEPERVVVDIANATLKGRAETPDDDNGLVRSVRLTQVDDDLVRCTVTLKEVAGYQLVKRLGPPRFELRLARGETRGRLVIVDPGHGGKDSGTHGYRDGLLEKDVVLDIGLRAADLLRGKGVRVVMTRSDDTFIPLYDRPAMANQLGADLFVSIHCNAMPDDKRGQRSGTELYYYTDQSASFADVMLQEFCSCAGLTGRGTYQRRFVVVRETTMPSVLVETGYLDHAGDGKKLETPEFRQRCALGVTHGVMRYLAQMPNPRVMALAPAD